MKPREITRDIMKQLEEKSGFPVQVVENTKLATTATIRIARDSIPAHVVSYKPASGTSPDYAICWQCVFAMRLFECPPEQRFQSAASSTGDRAIERLLLNSVGRKIHLTASQLEPLKQQLHAGLITHLRSVPVGLRVVSWLGENYPELHELEREFAEDEIRMGKDSLDPNISSIMPPEIFKPTTYINAAHAIFWASRLENPAYVNPYRSLGYEAEGKKLIELYNSVADEPAKDKALIDQWGAHLGIQDWYTWVPYTVS